MRCVLLWLAGIGATGSESDRVNGVAPPNAAVQYWNAYHEMFDHNEADDEWFHSQYLKAVENGPRSPLDEGTERIVKRLEPSLYFLHRGSRMDYCDWGLAHEEQGLGAKNGHMAWCKTVGMGACLRARYYLQHGKSRAAADDLLAALLLSRHLTNDGRDGSMGLLAGSGLETAALETAAGNLARIGTEDALRLRRVLDRLPKEEILKNLLGLERQVWVDWHIRYANRAINGGPWDPDWCVTMLRLSRGSDEADAIYRATGRTPQGLLKVANDAARHLDQAAKLLDMPDAEYDTQRVALRARAKENPLADPPFGAAIASRTLIRHHRVRRAMFQAAVAVSLGKAGGETLSEPSNPLNGRPIARKQHGDELELASEADGRTLSLRVDLSGVK
ncbi:MAG: hypothetical protein ACLP9L_25000 [Thermoguttaceae bacterium]